MSTHKHLPILPSFPKDGSRKDSWLCMEIEKLIEEHDVSCKERLPRIPHILLSGSPFHPKLAALQWKLTCYFINIIFIPWAQAHSLSFAFILYFSSWLWLTHIITMTHLHFLPSEIPVLAQFTSQSISQPTLFIRLTNWLLTIISM